MTVEVVVVEEPTESVPVAVAQAVTPGELAARLELLESRFDERISNVQDTAIDAAVTAEQAQETAEVAAVIATVTAEQADEVNEQDADAGGTGSEADEQEDGGETEETVKAPERREKPSNRAANNAQTQAHPQPRRYGASFLSGGR